MKFNNPHNITIFDSFFSNYGAKIDALWPQIRDFEMEVINTQSWSPILSDCIANYTPANIYDTPFYSFIGLYTNPTDKIHFIGVNDSVVAKINLTIGEQNALIMHEIGHLIAYVNAGCKPIWSEDLNEEYFPDDCAKELGLVNVIKSALNTMSQSPFYSATKQSEFIIRKDRL